MSRQNNSPSPKLSAIMCDGMGWFSHTDYKRVMLFYDEIYYLTPRQPVMFRDISGAERFMHFPILLREDPSFKIHYYEPDQNTRDLILLASKNDLAHPQFQAAVEAIPVRDRIYTWRIVNTDGDLGGGESIGITPDQQPLAHALLLNKFLLAADQLGFIPITGKSYIHTMIVEKYRIGIEGLSDLLP
jgi:hypothetical protein